MAQAPLTENRLRQAGLGSFFRPRQLEGLGIDYRRLQTLVREGAVERVARGLYRLVAVEPTEHYSLAAVCAQVPHAVICLLSALRVHGLGTRVASEVWVAIPHKARAPRIQGTGVRLMRFSADALEYGVVRTAFEGVPARVTNPARTVVDCFRFERLVGREASVEALRDALRQKKVTTDALYRTLAVLPSRRLHAVLGAMTP